MAHTPSTDPAQVSVFTFIDTIFPAELLSEGELAIYAKAVENAEGRIVFPCYPLRGPRTYPATHASLATFREDGKKPNGTVTRSVRTAVAVYAIVIDDVMDKVPEPALAPSWIMQTTPHCDTKPKGSFQFGYLLAEPVSVDEANVILGSLAAAGATDPGGNTPVRLFRTPGSKPPGKPYEAKLVLWRPDRIRDPATFLADFGVAEAKLAEFKATGSGEPPPEGLVVEDEVLDWLTEENKVLSAGASAGGFWAIECPWASGHTETTRPEAGYKPATQTDTQRQFKCHHSHCAGNHIGEFLFEVWRQGGPKVEPGWSLSQEDLSAALMEIANDEGDEASKSVKELLTLSHKPASEEPEGALPFDEGLRRVTEELVRVVGGKGIMVYHLPSVLVNRNAKPFGLDTARDMYARYDTISRKGKRTSPVDRWKVQTGNLCTDSPVISTPTMPSGFANTPEQLITDWINGVINVYVRPLPLAIMSNDMLHQTNLVRLFRHVFPDAGDADYMLDWCSYKVQHPDARMAAPVSVTPTQGTGRGTIFTIMEFCLGIANTASISTYTLLADSRFNNFQEKVLVTISEVEHGGGKEGMIESRRMFGRLKTIIDPDEPFVRIEHKGVDAVKVPATTAYLIASNSLGALPLGQGDRRFSVLNGNRVPLLTAQPDLVSWIRSWRSHNAPLAAEAINAFLRFFTSRNISAFLPSEPRDTRAKAAMINESRSNGDEIIEDLLEELGNPEVVTTALLSEAGASSKNQHIRDWMRDTKASSREIHGWSKNNTQAPTWVSPNGMKKRAGVVHRPRILTGSNLTDEKQGVAEFERFIKNVEALTLGKGLVQPAHLKLLRDLDES